MTTNEIKTLIQNTIAGQGSQVDIGGKLAEILVSIVDAMPSGETPQPIVLTSELTTDDTVETLAAKGLTLDEIQAAAQGMRTGVVIGNSFYTITQADYQGTGQGDENDIVFSQLYLDDTGQMNAMRETMAQIIDGVAYVRKWEI